MSCFIVPVNNTNRKGKFLFCFNPYPLDAIDDKIAIDGYLTEDDAKVLLKAWGENILKECFQDTDRTIIEAGAHWPFFGLNIKDHCKGQSLYDILKEKKLITQ